MTVEQDEAGLAGPGMEQHSLATPDRSMAEWFTDRAETYAEYPAVYVREGDKFVDRTFAEFLEAARSVAGGFQNRGVEPGDRIAIHAETRYEWSLVDAAAILAGAVLVPVYTSFTASDAAYVVDDAGAECLISDDVPVAPDLQKAVDEVISIDDLPTDDLDGLPGAGHDPDGLAALIYTSGTTGDPKGVRLTHRNFLAEFAVLREMLPDLDPGKSGTCYLPLAALAQRLTVYAHWDQGQAPVYMSTDTLLADLTASTPEIIVGVPRVWRRIHAEIEAEATALSGIKGTLLERGMTVATAYGRARESGSISPRLRAEHRLLDRIVFSKLRAKLGLTDVEYGITGTASTDADILHFFWGIGVPLIEVYGATETTAVCVGNRVDDFRAGTVGKPVPGTDVRLADDGEVLVRGPLVMDGYWNLPEKTESVFDGGWYRTGDIGEWTDDFLAIVDRKKFRAVLDTGRNLYPDPIEQALRGSTYVDEAMVLADNRKYVTALLQPDFDQLLALADDRGVEYDSESLERTDEGVVGVPSELLDAASIRERYDREVRQVNDTLADFETVKEYSLLDRALRVEAGELTPTLKKRRDRIEENFGDRIEELYSEN